MALTKNQKDILRNEASFLRSGPGSKNFKANLIIGYISAPDLSDSKIKQINDYYKKSPFQSNRFIRLKNK